jgi:flavin reductase (DIM6/NTAB) family NADH-FMN oxidoreductase RutF
MDAMEAAGPPVGLESLDLAGPVWDRVFVVAPLVLVGTLEEDGSADLAPKHMAMPLGRQNRFCFVCSHRHATLRNAVARKVFTVSFPRPGQILETSLAAGGRADDTSKPSLAALRTFPATVEGVVEGCTCISSAAWADRRGLRGQRVVVGEIVAASAAEDAIRHSEDDADVIASSPLLAYVSPGASRRSRSRSYRSVRLPA